MNQNYKYIYTTFICSICEQVDEYSDKIGVAGIRTNNCPHFMVKFLQNTDNNTFIYKVYFECKLCSNKNKVGVYFDTKINKIINDNLITEDTLNFPCCNNKATVKLLLMESDINSLNEQEPQIKNNFNNNFNQVRNEENESVIDLRFKNNNNMTNNNPIMNTTLNNNFNQNYQMNNNMVNNMNNNNYFIAENFLNRMMIGNNLTGNQFNNIVNNNMNNNQINYNNQMNNQMNNNMNKNMNNNMNNNQMNYNNQMNNNMNNNMVFNNNIMNFANNQINQNNNYNQNNLINESQLLFNRNQNNVNLAQSSLSNVNLNSDEILLKISDNKNMYSKIVKKSIKLKDALISLSQESEGYNYQDGQIIIYNAARLDVNKTIEELKIESGEALTIYSMNSSLYYK